MTQRLATIVFLSTVLTACGTESASTKSQPGGGIVPPPPSSITATSAASGAILQHWVGTTVALDPITIDDRDYFIASEGDASSGFMAAALTGMMPGTYALYSGELKLGNTRWTLAPGGSMTLESHNAYSWPPATLEATFVDTNGVAEPVIVRVTHGP